MKKEIFNINGLHCASCVSRVEEKLKSLKGIVSATVNLASGKANVEYDETLISPKDMKEAIDGLGYVFEIKKTKKMIIKVGGLHCASCVERLTKAFIENKGVYEANVNLASGKAFITYDPQIISELGLKEIIKNVGYEPVDSMNIDEENVEIDKKKKEFYFFYDIFFATFNCYYV